MTTTMIISRIKSTKTMIWNYTWWFKHCLSKIKMMITKTMIISKIKNNKTMIWSWIWWFKDHWLTMIIKVIIIIMIKSWITKQNHLMFWVNDCFIKIIRMMTKTMIGSKIKIIKIMIANIIKWPKIMEFKILFHLQNENSYIKSQLLISLVSHLPWCNIVRILIQIAIKFQKKALEYHLYNNCVMVRGIVKFHNLKSFPCYDFTHNYKPTFIFSRRCHWNER